MTTDIGTALSTKTAAHADVAIIRAFFEAVAARDFDTIGTLFHDDATWNHRNADRFGGVHHGLEAIRAFIGESMQLTAGTLRPVPQSYMPDGEGRVAVLVRLIGTRPDGRSSDDLQMVLFTLDADRVRAVDHFVGDPAAVMEFWA